MVKLGMERTEENGGFGEQSDARSRKLVAKAVTGVILL